MDNSEMVSSFLAQRGLYPLPEEGKAGLCFSLDAKNRLTLQGSPNDYIELADLLVSLALSGGSQGQHWHVDALTLMGKDSQIPEMILTRR